MKRLLTLLSVLVSTIALADPPTAAVGLSWNPNREADLAGYRIYRGTEPGSYSFVGEVGRTNRFVEAGLTPGVRYFWVVTAFNLTGLESEPSNEVQYLVPTLERPLPPGAARVAEVVIEQVRVNSETNRIIITP